MRPTAACILEMGSRDSDVLSSSADHMPAFVAAYDPAVIGSWQTAGTLVELLATLATLR